MDVLSDILKSMCLAGGVRFCEHLPSPWEMEFRDRPSASFHLLRRGECWLMSGWQTESLGPGDLVFVEPGRDHILASQVPGQDPPAAAPQSLLLSGYFDFATNTGTPLLGDLPSLTIVREEEFLKHPRLRSTLDQLSTEFLSQQAGATLVVNKLVEVALVELIRINFGREQRSHFVQALSDARMRQVLQLLHEKPGNHWTLENLAREIDMSRAAFSKRFKMLVGQPMFQYLTTLRMQRARELLAETTEPPQAIASRVGYRSDIAFAKTFRMHTGVTPTRFRKTAGGAARRP